MPAPPLPTPPSGDVNIQGTASNGGLSAFDKSVWAQIQQTLQSYGFRGNDLTQLVRWAKQQIIAGNSVDQIALNLMQTPEFERRFPAIKILAGEGIAITPAEYISMEQSYAQAEKMAGITPNFASYDQLIANQVSPTEYSDRLTQGYLAVENAPKEVQQAFYSYYHVTPAHLAQYFLNPKAMEPVLLKQALAAQIGGASMETGTHLPGQKSGQPIDQAEALRLAQTGVTGTQALQGFQNLGEKSQLYNPLPGQNVPYNFNQNNLAEAQFGADAQTQLELQIRADYEKNTTNSGTGVQQTQQGEQGVGSVQR